MHAAWKGGCDGGGIIDCCASSATPRPLKAGGCIQFSVLEVARLDATASIAHVKKCTAPNVKQAAYLKVWLGTLANSLLKRVEDHVFREAIFGVA